MYKFGLIGYPITHSLSPWIHSIFLEKLGLQGTYELFEVSPDESLERTLERLKDSGIQGCNVTVPYKEVVLPLLDDIDQDAYEIGAVNTIVFENGKTKGYNTDGKGYVRSLKESFPSLFTKTPLHVLILGAGGAARGIYSALLAENCTRISIANRTIESAKNIIQMNNTAISSHIYTLEEAEEKLQAYDLIIQTTSVGMKPDVQETILSLERIRPSTVVSDIVYQPIETQFLQDAKARECSIHYGHTMLLYQAQYAFELWTNQYPEIGTMDQQLQHILEES